MDSRGEGGEAHAPARQQSPASMTFVLKSQLEQIESRMKEIRNAGYEDAWGMHIPEELKPELRELKEQKKTVSAAIRGVATNG